MEDKILNSARNFLKENNIVSNLILLSNRDFYDFRDKLHNSGYQNFEGKVIFEGIRIIPSLEVKDGDAVPAFISSEGEFIL